MKPKMFAGESKGERGSSVLLMVVVITGGVLFMVASQRLFLASEIKQRGHQQKTDAYGAMLSQAVQRFGALLASGRAEVTEPSSTVNIQLLNEHGGHADEIGSDGTISSVDDHIIKLEVFDPKCLEQETSLAEECLSYVRITGEDIVEDGNGRRYLAGRASIHQPVEQSVPFRVRIRRVDEKVCSTATPDGYNIILIFDHSGSQTITDPGNIRGKAAENAFLPDLVQEIKDNPSMDIQLAIERFAHKSRTYAYHYEEGGARGINNLDGVNHWKSLTETNSSEFEEGIHWATRGPRGGTDYARSFEIAARLFDARKEEIRENGGDPAAYRNKVVFLSDGEPNLHRETECEIARSSYKLKLELSLGGSAFDRDREKDENDNGIHDKIEDEFCDGSMPTFTNPEDYQADIFAIAAGSGIREDKANRHIKPLSWYRGRYFRAATEKDVSYVWDKMAESMMTCEPTARNLVY